MKYKGKKGLGRNDFATAGENHERDKPRLTAGLADGRILIRNTNVK